MNESLRDTMKNCISSYFSREPVDIDVRTPDLANIVFNVLNISGVEQSESRNAFISQKK